VVTRPSVAVVTGGNGGIGRAIAMALAAGGFTTVLACRNRATAERAAGEIRAATRNGSVHVVGLDLADLESVAACAVALRETVPGVDVLVNNAGGAWRKRELSVQGFEATFAVNYLGHYALTRLLLDDLRRPGGRVVNVSSLGHRMVRGINWNDVGFDRGWRSMRAYAQSKLAQILFTRELASRADGIVSHAVHPGFVASNFYRGETVAERMMDQFVRLCARLGLAKSPEQGAAAAVHVATTSDAAASTGLYWADSKPRRPSRAARDVDAAERLWRLSESMVTGVGVSLPPCSPRTSS
jgi:NAD(P)-dependent dehydrogenase (short-subunit alcohol dehydrogenase family)